MGTHLNGTRRRAHCLNCLEKQGTHKRACERQGTHCNTRRDRDPQHCEYWWCWQTQPSNGLRANDSCTFGKVDSYPRRHASRSCCPYKPHFATAALSTEVLKKLPLVRSITFSQISIELAYIEVDSINACMLTCWYTEFAG